MQLPTVTDQYMMEMRSKVKNYALLLLKATPKRREPGADAIVREHGRRNHALRLYGVLSVVCPVTDGGELAGIGIFNTTPEELTQIMEGDPGVQAGIFTYEVHPVWGIPGDKLPGASC